MSLAGKTLFITGASRGIGLAIALRAAKDGANIAIAAKTAEPHKHLPGTIYTAADEIERAGGKALPLVVDVRDEASVAEAVDRTVQAFGGIDICVNNASAMQLTGTLATDMKRYDLMHQINTRGTFVTSRACLPHLKRAANPHVLMISPPLDMSPRWFGPHVAYTMAKFGMSMYVLGIAEKFNEDGVASTRPLAADRHRRRRPVRPRRRRRPSRTAPTSWPTPRAPSSTSRPARSPASSSSTTASSTRSACAISRSTASTRPGR
jgi:citronellol/citronellal dehydrogenase